MTGGLAHSKAFESLVKDNQDLPGLLAYALYKQIIHERAKQGTDTPQALRNLTDREIETYRSDAESRLKLFAQGAIEQATPDIVVANVGVEIQQASNDIIEELRRRTSFGSAIFSNMAAWVISLAITFLIITLFYLPNLQNDLIEAVRAAIQK